MSGLGAIDMVMDVPGSYQPSVEVFHGADFQKQRELDSKSDIIATPGQNQHQDGET